MHQTKYICHGCFISCELIVFDTKARTFTGCIVEWEEIKNQRIQPLDLLSLFRPKVLLVRSFDFVDDFNKSE